MYKPTKEEFVKLSKEGSLVPVCCEVMADCETPVSAYLKLGTRAYSFLLESVEGGEKVGRYSFIGGEPLFVFESKGREVKIREKGETLREICADPLEALREKMGKYRPVRVDGLPPFTGGAVGFVGYDTVKFWERLPDRKEDTGHIPDCCFMLVDTVVAFDHLRRIIQVITNVNLESERNPGSAYDAAVARIELILSKLARPLTRKAATLSIQGDGTAYSTAFARKDFENAVRKAKDYIEMGDIFQVVISRKLAAPYQKDPLQLYRALRMINPSPYLFYLNMGLYQLAGSSPEINVRLNGEEAQVRPIAGTRPRGKTPEADQALAAELAADEKERAEHLMLVDLGRNDLGRVCTYGTVKVRDFMTVERYSHVMHLVSTVTGRLKPEYDAFALFKATFPAGTVSGAPKVRAMEIIHELEPEARGPYAGAVGYFAFSGEMDTCITIRTILVADGKAYVQSGAGIVADSDPAREWEETENKAKGMLKAICIAGGGMK
ncbi:MAG: anthranilate synthase component I [Bacillota bacterium]